MMHLYIHLKYPHVHVTNRRGDRYASDLVYGVLQNFVCQTVVDLKYVCLLLAKVGADTSHQLGGE